jgi:hypothetical protein
LGYSSQVVFEEGCFATSSQMMDTLDTDKVIFGEVHGMPLSD